MSALQKMHHFDFLSSSSPRPPYYSASVATSTSYNCAALPGLGKKLKKQQGLRRIVNPLPALLLVLPVMKGLKNSADYPEVDQHRSNLKPCSSRGGGAGRGGKRDQQQWGGDDKDGFKDRRRYREGCVGSGADSYLCNPRFEYRPSVGRGLGYSGGRFRGRDGKGREENGCFRHAAVRRPRSGPGTEEHRYWRSAGEELGNYTDKFVMVSYNILADKNASEHYRGLYHHIPWWLLEWERRKNKIVFELDLWSPDIMCLQEVDQFEDLRIEFEKRGYQGAYKQRTGGSQDGCAMFWRSNRFVLLQEGSIQFEEHGLKNNVAQLCVFQSIGGNENKEADPTDANGSLGNVVVVGNIHVLFNPKRGDIKLGQVRVLLETAHSLSQTWNNAPVVIGGDFNSTPTSSIYQYLSNSQLDLSGLNRLNLSGQVEVEQAQASGWSSSVRVSETSWSNGGSESLESRYTRSVGTVMDVGAAGPSSESREKFVSCVEASTSYELRSGSSTSGAEILQAETTTVSGTGKSIRGWYWTPEEMVAATGTVDDTVVRHKLNLCSAYTQIRGEVGCRDRQGEPLVTTYHKKFMGTVDYIWHTEGLVTARVLDTLPVAVLQRCQGLPSHKWGSDHLSLACELAFLSS
ncbi:hypothetical protein R1flu_011346 [Riccia fluitans]|uniref:Endonuclease/exonuclease/phosphatase domain-containing protein n=1 Tax=Riccia fluitans TaxID=41844 RepID=A0ABD1ZA24_9MARC